MKALFDRVIIECGYPFEEKASGTGLDLQIDHQFNPTKYTKTRGEVISAGHTTEGLKAGDDVFFHYGALDINPQTKEVAEGQYIIDFKDIFCVIEEGVIRAIGKWTICEKVEVEIPKGFHLEDMEDNKILVSDATGIVADQNWTIYETNKMKVVSSPDGSMDGKIVQTPDDCDFDNYGRTINDIQYFYLESDLIDGVWEA